MAEPAYDTFILFDYDQEKLSEMHEKKELEEQLDLFAERTMRFITDLIASWRSRFSTNPRTEEFIAELIEDYTGELNLLRKAPHHVNEVTLSDVAGCYILPKDDDSVMIEDVYYDTSAQYNEYPYAPVHVFKQLRRMQFADLMRSARDNTETLRDGLDTEYQTIGWSQSLPQRITVT